MNTPALLTSVSIRPNRSTASLTTRSAIAGSVMSPSTASTVRANDVGFADGARVGDDAIAEIAEPFDKARANALGRAGDDCDFLFGAHDCSCSVGRRIPRIDELVGAPRLCADCHGLVISC